MTEQDHCEYLGPVPGAWREINPDAEKLFRTEESDDTEQ